MSSFSPGKGSEPPAIFSWVAIRSRSPRRKIGLIAFGLLMWSVAMREVSEVPGGCAASSS
jgi:hypothetical protein